MSWPTCFIEGDCVRLSQKKLKMTADEVAAARQLSPTLHALFRLFKTASVGPLTSRVLLPMCADDPFSWSGVTSGYKLGKLHSKNDVRDRKFVAGHVLIAFPPPDPELSLLSPII